MRKCWLISLACTLLYGFTSCQTYHTIQFFAINDTYEIAPLSNGTVGGMARVATAFRQQQAKHPHTFFVHAGDFLSPSVIGTLHHQGKRIAGKHMVETMNAAGVQYATFGNHELDVEEADLLARIEEADFQWLVANLESKQDTQRQPFMQHGKPIPRSVILQTDRLKVGMLAVTIPVEKPYAAFEDFLVAAEKEYQQIVPQCDAVVALTHLELAQDVALARRLPGLALIIGGHDHENMRYKIGNTIIAKADANAKTAYLHRLKVATRTRKQKVRSRLISISAQLPEEPATAAVVQKWQHIADKSFTEMGFRAAEVVATAHQPWDGMEKSVRNAPTNLSRMIAEAVKAAFPDADAAIINAGSIRIDDQLEGNITQYDIMRILPFGGGLAKMKITGALLLEVLASGLKNKGLGGYLVHAAITQNSEGTWLIGNEAIDKSKVYTLATTDFLISGKEFNLSFFNAQNPQISDLQIFKDTNDFRSDIRKVFMHYLQQSTKKK
ncbi:MAG: bifunctional metallophosphatase/5'-nucleotidase [Cytophagales bacterium]|nr:bifunctional metallophosphatase/5'-nucleotidase [Bernardetiaceae bacterium]MDW8206026.1 bifunctional metallophosphatase/5'-nucleotidase [Cytophagales bacterium]